MADVIPGPGFEGDTDNTMTIPEVQALLNAMKWDSMASVRNSKLTEERTRALMYYQGDISMDMPAIEGRSRAVSMDVSDTIEGLMPTLMEIFAGSDDVVQFTPFGPEDIQAAQQESDYVNYIFNQKNPGFIVLYSFIKDALLSKVGVVKVWTETENRLDREKFFDQPDDVMGIIATDPGIEIVAHTEKTGPMGESLHDITVQRTKQVKRHRVQTVPPEEFGISRNARCIADCGYLFHQVRRPMGQLVDEGYDENQIRNLPIWTGPAHNAEEIARDTVNESIFATGDEAANWPTRMVVITEHHVRMDFHKDGRPSLYRVMTGGEQGEVLLRNGEPVIIEENHIPFAAMTPFIITHRFWGRSVADLVVDIQRVKTALTRAMLDNAYMAVNPRPEVAEAMSTDTTLDDLLIMRPGQPIRVKQPGGINWQVVPFVAENLLPVVQYMDTTREWRTGVNRQSQGVNPNALQNQVATIANQMQSASDAKVKLIARIFAETGVKDLFTLLHAEIRENGDQEEIVRLRNQWTPVDPRVWKERQDMTVNVGLGTGSKQEELAKLQLLITAQTQAIQVGMVSRENLWHSAQQLVRLTGRKDPESYFVNPSAPPQQNDPAAQPIPPPQPPQDPNAAKTQATLIANQQKAQLEQQQAQADQGREAAQAQSQIAIANQKWELEKQSKQLDMQRDAQKHQYDMEALAARNSAEQLKQQTPRASIEVKHGADALAGPMGEMVNQLGQHVADTIGAHTKALTDALAAHSQAMAHASKPKRIRKTGNGEYVTEVVQ